MFNSGSFTKLMPTFFGSALRLSDEKYNRLANNKTPANPTDMA
jgi:hypothetical protein